LDLFLNFFPKNPQENFNFALANPRGEAQMMAHTQRAIWMDASKGRHSRAGPRQVVGDKGWHQRIGAGQRQRAGQAKAQGKKSADNCFQSGPPMFQPFKLRLHLIGFFVDKLQRFKKILFAQFLW